MVFVFFHLSCFTKHNTLQVINEHSGAFTYLNFCFLCIYTSEQNCWII